MLLVSEYSDQMFFSQFTLVFLTDTEIFFFYYYYYYYYFEDVKQPVEFMQ